MKTAEKIITAVAIIFVAYIGISYFVTGSPFSSPGDIGDNVVHPTYEVRYKVGISWGSPVIEYVQISRRKMSIAPRQYCLPGTGWEGKAVVTVDTPSGVKIIQRKGIDLCPDGTVVHAPIFTAKSTGEYTATIHIKNKKGNEVATKSVSKQVIVG